MLAPWALNFTCLLAQFLLYFQPEKEAMLYTKILVLTQVLLDGPFLQYWLYLLTWHPQEKLLTNTDTVWEDIDGFIWISRSLLCLKHLNLRKHGMYVKSKRQKITSTIRSGCVCVPRRSHPGESQNVQPTADQTNSSDIAGWKLFDVLYTHKVYGLRNVKAETYRLRLKAFHIYQKVNLFKQTNKQKRLWGDKPHCLNCNKSSP